jgi:hypothetical protein
MHGQTASAPDNLDVALGIQQQDELQVHLGQPKRASATGPLAPEAERQAGKLCAEAGFFPGSVTLFAEPWNFTRKRAELVRIERVNPVDPRGQRLAKDGFDHAFFAVLGQQRETLLAVR